MAALICNGWITTGQILDAARGECAPRLCSKTRAAIGGGLHRGLEVSISQRHRQGVPLVCCFFFAICRWHKLDGSTTPCVVAGCVVTWEGWRTCNSLWSRWYLGVCPTGALVGSELCIRIGWLECVAPQGFGVLTWECAGSLAGGNIFLPCPPGWVRAAFSMLVSAWGLDGPAGCAKGSRKGPTKESPPFQVRGMSARCKKSLEGDGSR